jgi:hypothetical protein
MVNNTPRYKEWDLFQNALQTFPKQLSPKAQHKNLKLRQ